MRRFIRRVLKTLFILAILFVLTLIGVAGTLYYLSKSRIPVLDGTVSHAGIKDNVNVIRDDWGVPHITASNEADANFALGYCMAQDRLFQMEAFRRLAQGRLAEIAGPPAVSVDRIMRAFRLKPKADEYFATPGRVPADLDKTLDAFVAGVNAFMDDGPLPFEFAVLGVPKEPFTKADCMSVAALLPITFSDGMREDPLASMLKTRWPKKDIDALFPGYSKEIPTTVMETLEEAAAYVKKNSPPPAEKPKPPALERTAPQALQALLEPLRELTDAIGPTLGSNSWVLAGNRTESGAPILANDPHIGFTNPSIWYQAHVKFGDFENYGYYMAPIPIALLGHNADRGWALTMFANDDMDLYVEKFKDDDPKKVMYKGEWTDVQVMHETIRVRFGKEVDFDVRVTPHGPIITDFLTGAYAYHGPDVAMSWVWQHVDSTDLLAFYGMGHARDYDSFEKAVALVTSPGVNVSYADREGNIAWWAAGKIVKRPANVNPKQLLDGASGQDEILGYLPFEQNPHLKNPERGYIVTANNMSTVKPLPDGVALQGYWQPTDRAARITQLLESRPKWSVESLKAIQFDDVSIAAPKLLECIFPILHGTKLEPVETEALGILEKWRYDHGTESVGATIYQNLNDSILEKGAGDEIGADLMPTYGTVADHWNFYKSFVTDADSPFWDDVTTDKVETRQDIVVAAYKDTVSRLRAQLGDSPAQWTWGRVHTVEFRHPFGYLPVLDRIFDVGPFPASGGDEIINNMLYRSGAHDYHVIVGPSTRRLIDFSHPEQSLTILPTGNSGHFRSPHYGDQAPLYMRGGYRQAYMDAETIKQHKEHEMRFVPMNRQTSI